MDLSVAKANSALSLLPQIALRYLNIPYIYGGKSALVGLDCSGLVCELLQALGLIGPNEDMNSQQLYDKFKGTFDDVVGVGSLAFYGKSLPQIDHVAMFLDTHLVIEAGHGDATTTSIEAARQRDAKVRVRPFNYRKDLVAITRPDFENFGYHE